MNIFIIGGTGFISSSLTKKLLERGHEVTLFTRGKSKSNLPKNPKLNFEFGNRDNFSSLYNSADGKFFDVIYDMIAYTSEETEASVKIFKGKVGRFIHCSTISVYMISDNVKLPVTEDQDKLPIMDYSPRNPFGMDYGINKRKCEDILWKEHDDKLFPVSMLRPTYVSGAGDPMKRDYFWIERILDGYPLLVPGTGKHKFQQVYVEDVSEAFAKIIETDKSIGEAYNIASEDVFTLNEYLQRLSLLLQETKIYHLDQDQFDSLDLSSSNSGDVFPFNTRRDAHFSLDKIKKDIGYSATPFNDWMTKTIDWYLNEFNGHSVGYEKRQKEIKIINELEQKTQKK